MRKLAAVVLLLATVARDKVEGVALSKATGILSPAPLVVWYSPGMWTLAGAPIPGIWVALTLLPMVQRSAPSYGIWMTGTVATLVTSVWLWFLIRRFTTTHTHGV